MLFEEFVAFSEHITSKIDIQFNSLKGCALIDLSPGSD